MKRTTVFLDEGQERDLKALAALKGEPAAALVREAIGEYLVRHRRRDLQLGFLGAGHSGRGDVAETHEQLLWKDLAPHGTADKGERARPATKRPLKARRRSR